ncbi:MAG: hypothetical protein IKZ61_03665 [Prevotella sp.]|nr:hypothetical protein [Prevotella sp.]
MKNLYVKPIADVTPIYAQPIMAGSEQGVIGEDMAKKHDEIVDDEEETSIVEKEAKPMTFFTNDYIKKIWD